MKTSKKNFVVILSILVILLNTPTVSMATDLVQIKEHHPPGLFLDPTNVYDGYTIGDTLTFHLHLNLTARGVGPNANDIVSIRSLNITDVLPIGLSYVLLSETTTLPIPYTFTQMGQNLVWEFDHAEIDSVQSDGWQVGISFDAVINPSVSDDTYLVNQVISEYYETISEADSNPTTTDTIWIARPVLDIEKPYQGSVEAGGSFEYSVTLTNTGHLDADVMVIDTLPTEVIYVPGDASATADSIIDNSTHVVWSGTVENVNGQNTVIITIPVTHDENNPAESFTNYVAYVEVPEDAVMLSESDECTTEVTITVGGEIRPVIDDSTRLLMQGIVALILVGVFVIYRKH